LAAALKDIAGNVTGVQGDVSNLGHLDRLLDQMKREKSKLDIGSPMPVVRRMPPSVSAPPQPS
jgi:hypothetical protein